VGGLFWCRFKLDLLNLLPSLIPRLPTRPSTPLSRVGSRERLPSPSFRNYTLVNPQVGSPRTWECVIQAPGVHPNPVDGGRSRDRQHDSAKNFIFWPLEPMQKVQEIWSPCPNLHHQQKQDLGRGTIVRQTPLHKRPSPKVLRWRSSPSQARLGEQATPISKSQAHPNAQPDESGALRSLQLIRAPHRIKHRQSITQTF